MKLDELRQKAKGGEFKDTRPRSDPPPAIGPERLWFRYQERDDDFIVTVDGQLSAWDFKYVQESILDFAKGWARWPASTTIQIEAEATPPYGHLTAMYSYAKDGVDDISGTTTTPIGFDFAGEHDTIRVPKFRS